MTKKGLRFFLMMFLLCCSRMVTAAWIPVKTGISDNFNSVYFWNAGRVGVLAGDKGLYYTTTGGTSATSWKRFEITQNASDAERYNHCKFLSVSATEVAQDTNIAYACGWDSIENKAVVLFVNLNNSNYSFQYIGAVGSKLNSIKMLYSYFIYAVGNNGLIIRSDMTSFKEVPSLTTKNLLSVDISYDKYIAIGGEQIFISGYDSGLLKPYDQTYTFRDVFSLNPVTAKKNYGVGKTFYYTNDNGLSYTPSSYKYKFGELEAQCLTGGYNNYIYYVGTTHGIFKTNGPPTDSRSVMELQPSSKGYHINDICFLQGSQTLGYAAGKNGVFLYTTDGGGLPIPLTSLNLKGTCTGSSISLNGNTGTGTICTWLVNDIFASTACSYSRGFTPAGAYKITHISKNADGFADTASQTIYIVDPPTINLPVSISKNKICKKEEVEVSIEGTQKNYLYQFMNKNWTVIGSASGTGQKLVFKVVLSEGGSYFIRVKSEIADCEKSFTDSIRVTVEKTKADFHATLINAMPSEGVEFFQQCKDAQHFAWTFSNNATLSVDSTDHPAGIKFKTLGKSNVKLIAWSNYGCYDTIVKEGPFIYNESSSDSCWAFNLNTTDPSWYGNEDISQQVLTPDGYLIAGSSYKTLFTSRVGNTFDRSKDGGVFLAKYSRSGVLKWVDYGISPGYNSTGSSSYISSICTSLSDGSIYMIGSMNPYQFYSNSGDSIKQPGLKYANFLMKLNSSGHVTWIKAILEANSYRPFKIKEDKSGDLLVAMGYSNGGAQIDFVKFDKDGNRKWIFLFDDDNSSRYSFRDFDFDGQNNILITGGLDYYVTFRSVDGKVARTINSPDNSGTKMFVVSYTPDGYYKWSMFEHIGSADTYAIVADSTGNSYVSGSNRCSYKDCFAFTNADNSIYKNDVGAYFLLKIDPFGKITWANGSKLAYYGYGFSIALKNDEVSVLGSVSNNSVPWSGIMTSTNGLDLNYNIGSYDLFIANYTTSGILKSITSTGPNAPAHLGNNYSLLRDEQENYFFSGNIRGLSGPYVIGLDSITTNGFDGIMVKMSKTACNKMIVTGIENIDPTAQLPDADIFPNPTTDKLTIFLKNSSKEYDLKIYNIPGACVYSKHVSGSTFSVNKKEWSDGTTGLYFMHFIFNDQTVDFSKKIIVTD